MLPKKNETRAFCPECKKPVRLHRRGKAGKPVAHFEHLSRTGRCPLHYRRRVTENFRIQAARLNNQERGVT